MKSYSYEKLFILMFMALFLMPMVASVSPFETEFSGDTNLVIESNIMDNYKINEGACVHIYVFNKTTGTQEDNTMVSCKAELTNHNGTLLLEGHPVLHEDHFLMCRPPSIITEPDNYGLSLVCNNSGGLYGIKTHFFEANQVGLGLTPAWATGYFTIMIFFVLVFSFFVFLYYHNDHIAIKTFAFGGGYLMAMFMAYIGWIYSLNWINVTDFIPALFKWTFMIMIIALPFIVMISLAYVIWLMITVPPIKRMMERGEVGDPSFESGLKRDLRKLKRENDFQRLQG